MPGGRGVPPQHPHDSPPAAGLPPPLPRLPPARLPAAPSASPGQGLSATRPGPQRRGPLSAARPERPRRPPAASPCPSRLGGQRRRGDSPPRRSPWGCRAGLPRPSRRCPPSLPPASASRRAPPAPPPGLTGRLRRFRLPHAAGGGHRAEGRVRPLPSPPVPVTGGRRSREHRGVPPRAAGRGRGSPGGNGEPGPRGPLAAQSPVSLINSSLFV